jgi:hypothetical protein
LRRNFQSHLFATNHSEANYAKPRWFRADWDLGRLDHEPFINFLYKAENHHTRFTLLSIFPHTVLL